VTATLFESGATQAVAQVMASDGTVLTDRAVTWIASQPFASVTPAAAAWTADVAAIACKAWSSGTTDPDADEDCEVNIVASADGVGNAPAQGHLTILKPVARITILKSGPFPGVLYQQETLTAQLAAADSTPVLKRGSSVQWQVTQGTRVTLSQTIGQSTVAIAVPPGGQFVTIEGGISQIGGVLKKSITLWVIS
jgi:hypothetical protein